MHAHTKQLCGYRVLLDKTNTHLTNAFIQRPFTHTHTYRYAKFFHYNRKRSPRYLCSPNYACANLINNHTLYNQCIKYK